MEPEAQETAPSEADRLVGVRAVAELISDFRAEVMDRIRMDVEEEIAQIEADGYDPARGRGRGPHWMKDG